jgi:hypothetical protein
MMDSATARTVLAILPRAAQGQWDHIIIGEQVMRI